MYVRTLESPGLGWGWRLPTIPQPPLRIPTFTSSVIRYKDNDANDRARPTMCSVYVPSALRNQKEIDVLVFFHGHDIDLCKIHKFDPEQVVKNFRLDNQVEIAKRKVALAVPSIFWSYDGHPGSDLKNIRAAWSAAYLNAFVEEVLVQIGKLSSVRPSLGHLILAGHSRAYDILTPLADQFDLGVPETTKGALAKLDKVLAMDTTYGWGFEHAKALENWARQLETKKPKPVQFILVLSNGGTPPKVWKAWRQRMDRAKVKLPTNLTVHEKTDKKDHHCAIVEKYVESFL
jgi:hypothetical protein